MMNKKVIGAITVGLLIFSVSGLWIVDNKRQAIEEEAVRLMQRPDTRPVYILNVDPDPGATLEKSPDHIRVDIRGRPPLLKPGDFRRYIPARLILDGKSYGSANTIVSIDIAYELRDDTDEVIARGPWEDRMTWPDISISELDAGIHLATIVLRAVDGERFSYSWAFEVTSKIE